MSGGDDCRKSRGIDKVGHAPRRNRRHVDYERGGVGQFGSSDDNLHYNINSIHAISKDHAYH